MKTIYNSRRPESRQQGRNPVPTRALGLVIHGSWRTLKPGGLVFCDWLRRSGSKIEFTGSTDAGTVCPTGPIDIWPPAQPGQRV
jgi:hypothetical protein